MKDYSYNSYDVVIRIDRHQIPIYYSISFVSDKVRQDFIKEYGPDRCKIEKEEPTIHKHIVNETAEEAMKDLQIDKVLGAISSLDTNERETLRFFLNNNK